MCGIFAAIALENKFDQEDARHFEGLTDLIDYRGPDAGACETYKINEAQDSGFEIFFGHRRLAIIELSDAGKQPMCFDEISIVFNGEIFNYLELRADLLKQGVDFKTQTDTEVIIRTYLHHGEKGFAAFNGMWSFVIYDARKKKIVASRDRFSIKPLYVLQQAGKIYFASEIKQLSPLLTEKTLNSRVMSKFLNQALLEDSNETFLNTIEKVPPRHNFCIDLVSKKFEFTSYWDFERSNQLQTDNLIESFRTLLIDSINIRLRSDVKTGSLLSGGLDSSAITVLAALQNPDTFESFSVVSEQKKYSEEHFIDLLVMEKNVRNKKLMLVPDQLISQLDKVIFHQDEPFAGFSIVAQYQIFQKIKEETDITVVLSGQGGDEILMGYLKFYFFYLRHLAKNRKYFKAAQEVLASLIHRTVMWQLDLGEAKRYLPSKASQIPDFYLQPYDAETTWIANDLRERQILDIERFSVPALAHYEDRNSMAWSIESRLPFLDHRLVNFMLNVHTAEKIKNGWNKYLLRKSIHEMPTKIRWRRDKMGFTIPEELWSKKELKPLIEEAFSDSILASLGIINSKKFLHAYYLFLHGKSNMHYSEVIRLFIAERWAKMQFNQV